MYIYLLYHKTSFLSSIDKKRKIWYNICVVQLCATFTFRTPYMKKVIMSAIATSALWAAVAFTLLHWEHYYLLSASEASSLAEQYERVYNAGYQAYVALQQCRKAI